MDLSHFEQNPFVTGGLILMALGGALYYLKQLPGMLYGFVERFFFLKIEILDSDEAYQWMQLWLADKLQRTLSVSVLTKRGNPTGAPAEEDDELSARSDNRPAIYFVPAVGT